ncbi:MAG: hypothetical protein ACTSUV_04905 [Candidatus Ranarchaeia archaeon]
MHFICIQKSSTKNPQAEIVIKKDASYSSDCITPSSVSSCCRTPEQKIAKIEENIQDLVSSISVHWIK